MTSIKRIGTLGTYRYIIRGIQVPILRMIYDRMLSSSNIVLRLNLIRSY